MPGAMTLNDWTSLITCAGILTLGFVVLLRRAPRSAVISLPLGLLCLDMFVWNFTGLAHGLSGKPQWYWLDVSFSPLTPPLALHVVLAFVGRLRRLRWLLALFYALFGALALSSAAAFFVPAAQAWAGSRAWHLTYLGAAAPLVLLALALLLRHTRATAAPDEQMRARLILAAVLVGALLASTEAWGAAVDVPSLGHLGALISMAMVAMVVLRLRLFGRELSTSVAIYAVALAAASVVGYLAVFRWFGTNSALLVLGTASITLGLLAAAREVVGSLQARRGRAQQLTALGRFSAQMAHDLKNPLAALKGALQFQQQELAQGRPAQQEFMELMAEQVERLEQVIERYGRLSSVEPRPTLLQLNELVAAAVASRRATEGPSIEVEQQLDPKLPECSADGDLLAGVVENLLRNAWEAMPEGGTLAVRTGAAELEGGVPAVQLAVQDSGAGLDARQRERVFDDFYTTKAEGSGLGLPFARRVVEAHGGSVRLDSALGQGTTVTLRLPLGGPLKPGESQ